jgi:hypothetical protein
MVRFGSRLTIAQVRLKEFPGVGDVIADIVTKLHLTGDQLRTTIGRRRSTLFMQPSGRVPACLW